MSEPIQLVTNRPDADLAEELKARMKDVYINHLMPILDDAVKYQLIIQAAVCMGPFGKHIIQNIDVIKKF